MPLFDFLRSKRNQPDPEFVQLMEKTKALMFPGGPTQISTEQADLGARLGHRYPEDQLQNLFMHASARYFIAEDPGDEEVFLYSVMQRPFGLPLDQLLSRTDAQLVYEFMHEKFNRQHYQQQFGNELAKGMLNGLLGINNGTTADELPGAYGEYGYDPSNPIPVRGIIFARVYLNRLRTADGERITYDRQGSFVSEVSMNLVDGYRIIDSTGFQMALLFLSPYEQSISRRPPAGFRLA